MKGKLGFGTMRLPLTDSNDPASIDMEQLSRMVDMFLQRGFTYFDTAYTYHDGHCEEALRRALVERYPREAYSLTDKLPTLIIEREEQQEAIFAEQLKRCGVEWFDRYLVHCATSAFYAKAEELRSLDFALRKKSEGLTRQVGFSYHDTPELLEEILTKYPDVDFVQLQISYMDWEHTPIQARRCYETARRHGKPIVVMCPLKGGLLVDVPVAAERLMHELDPKSTPTSWALRYAASPEGVETVLSGMSSVEQMERNTSYLEYFEPLNERERAMIGKVADIVARAEPVQCTSCGYCVPTCPQHIPIPDDLWLFNADTEAGHEGFDARRASYETAADGRGKASDCIECRNCENACPQHIEIVDWLHRVSERFETKRAAGTL